MDEYLDKLTMIRDFLEDKAPQKLSISAIAREVGMNRGSVSKYLDILRLNGHVTVEHFGKSKLYATSRRISAHQLFDYTSDLIVVVDSQMCIQMVNNSFFRKFNIRRERSVIGANLFDLGLELFSDSSVQRNIERLARGATFINEIQYIEEKTNRVYYINFVPTVSQNGNQDIIISLRDITDQKQTEEALLISDKRLRTIFRRVPSGIIFFDRSGNILNANKATLDLFGLRSLQELIPVKLFDISCDPKQFEAFIDKNESGETDFICDFDRLKARKIIPTTRSGIVYYNVVYTAIASEESAVNEYAIMFRDVTNDRMTRKELIFKESRYRSFFNDTCNGVLIYQPIQDGQEYVFKDINHVTERILGMKKVNLIGKRLFEEFPDLPDPGVRDALIRVLNTENPEVLPPLQYVKGIDSPWLSHYIFKLPSGEIASFMIDISDEVRMELASVKETSGTNEMHFNFRKATDDLSD